MCARSCVWTHVFSCVWYVCVCVRSKCVRDPRARPLPLSVVFLHIRVHLISWSPSEALVEAAISTQHSPQATWKAFYPALFFNQHSSFTCLRPNHLICICSVTSQQTHNTAFFFFSQPFHLICKFPFCFEKCQSGKIRPIHMLTKKQISSPSCVKENWQKNEEAETKPDAHTRVSSFSFPHVLQREPFNACSVAAYKAGPFDCGSPSESET